MAVLPFSIPFVADIRTTTSTTMHSIIVDFSVISRFITLLFQTDSKRKIGSTSLFFAPGQVDYFEIVCLHVDNLVVKEQCVYQVTF